MNLVTMTLKGMKIDESLEYMEAVMREVKPSHKVLYTIMTWKMAKLLFKFTDSLDLSTQYSLGVAIKKLKLAKDYLKKSKEAGGE